MMHCDHNETTQLLTSEHSGSLQQLGVVDE